MTYIEESMPDDFNNALPSIGKLMKDSYASALGLFELSSIVFVLAVGIAAQHWLVLLVTCIAALVSGATLFSYRYETLRPFTRWNGPLRGVRLQDGTVYFLRGEDVMRKAQTSDLCWTVIGKWVPRRVDWLADLGLLMIVLPGANPDHRKTAICGFRIRLVKSGSEFSASQLCCVHEEARVTCISRAVHERTCLP